MHRPFFRNTPIFNSMGLNLKNLHQAAMLADNDLITELIKSIPENNTILIHALISLIDNFCYNQIMDSTQQVFGK